MQQNAAPSISTINMKGTERRKLSLFRTIIKTRTLVRWRWGKGSSLYYSCSSRNRRKHPCIILVYFRGSCSFTCPVHCSVNGISSCLKTHTHTQFWKKVPLFYLLLPYHMEHHNFFSATLFTLTPISMLMNLKAVIPVLNLRMFVFST